MVRLYIKFAASACASAVAAAIIAGCLYIIFFIHSPSCCANFMIFKPVNKFYINGYVYFISIQLIFFLCINFIFIILLL